MFPLELKVDKNGLLYTDDRNLLSDPILIDKRELSEDRYYTNGFYRFNSTDDYLIKYSYTGLTRKERDNYMEMLANLVDKQMLIPNTEFPIGYFRERRKFAGLIVKYYKNGISLDNIIGARDLNLLGKYYYHDADNIRNLFLIFEDLLYILYEMFENGVYYLDINTGNIVIDNNKTKLIDFDPFYVRFDQKDQRLATIMRFYIDLINGILEKYNLLNGKINETLNNFEEANVYTKKLENVIRRG